MIKKEIKKLLILLTFLLTTTLIITGLFLWNGAHRSLPEISQTPVPGTIKDPATGLEFEQNTVLILFKEDTTTSQIKTTLDFYHLKVKRKDNLSGVYVASFNDSLKTSEFLDKVKSLNSNPFIQVATLNGVYSTNETPNDPYNGNVSWTGDLQADNWNLEAIDALGAWQEGKAKSTINVGVIDGGFFLSHEDLQIPINHFSSQDQNPKSSNITNENHGTHVTGIIAAIQNNGKGITGIVPNENKSIYLYKTNYLDSEILAGLQWLVEHNCKVINLSLGCTISKELSEKDSTNYIDEQTELYSNVLKRLLKTHDFLVVQAAGNSAVNAKWNGLFSAITDPSLKSHILIVGSVGRTNNILSCMAVCFKWGTPFYPQSGDYFLSSFSNYGNTVDILAPGENIESTISNNEYELLTGTSQAAPHVTGVAAYVWEQNPKLKSEDVKKILLKSEDDDIVYKGISRGIVNAKNAVSLVQEKPMENPQMHQMSLLSNLLPYLIVLFELYILSKRKSLTSLVLTIILLILFYMTTVCS